MDHFVYLIFGKTHFQQTLLVSSKKGKYTHRSPTQKVQFTIRLNISLLPNHVDLKSLINQHIATACDSMKTHSSGFQILPGKADNQTYQLYCLMFCSLERILFTSFSGHICIYKLYLKYFPFLCQLILIFHEGIEISIRVVFLKPVLFMQFVSLERVQVHLIKEILLGK